MIKERNVANSVDLKNAELTVVIEVIRSICCIGVVPNYAKLRKYNLVEICSTADKKKVVEGTVDKSVDQTSVTTPDVSSNIASGNVHENLENSASSNACAPDSSNDPSCGQSGEEPHSE